MQFPIEYQNGNTVVKLFNDGTKERWLITPGEVPTPVFPESIDVKITDYCDAGCAYCHENSTVYGKHGDLEVLLPLLLQLPAGTELALGGGNPLAHPDFNWFVEHLASAGIICNVTVNEMHFEAAVPRLRKLISRGSIQGVGYSYNKVPCLYDMPNLVNHVIVGVTPLNHLKRLTEKHKKVLLLGYKFDTGRGPHFAMANQSVLDNIDGWRKGLAWAAHQVDILSFDNKAIQQLDPKRILKDQTKYSQFYMGNDGEYTMYIDAVKQRYAVSSTTKTQFRLPYETEIANMFQRIRFMNNN